MTTRQRLSGRRARGTSIHAAAVLWMLAVLLGAVVMAGIAAAKSGALPVLPAKLVLGLSIPLFYAAALGAIRRDGSRGPSSALREGPRRADFALVEEQTGRRVSEIEQVQRWRRARLVALGVADEPARILAARAELSVHELERLLEAGCSLGTALRILDPI
jgi:hypothetical protein